MENQYCTRMTVRCPLLTLQGCNGAPQRSNLFTPFHWRFGPEKRELTYYCKFVGNW